MEKKSQQSENIKKLGKFSSVPFKLTDGCFFKLAMDKPCIFGCFFFYKFNKKFILFFSRRLFSFCETDFFLNENISEVIWTNECQSEYFIIFFSPVLDSGNTFRIVYVYPYRKILLNLCNVELYIFILFTYLYLQLKSLYQA